MNLLRSVIAAVLPAVVVLLPAAAGAAARPGWITSCNYSHSATDDPIVHAGRPGASHPHDFLGARSTGASSTPDSMREGGTTCAMPDDSSAYWSPALRVNGKRVLPVATARHGLFYYRRVAAPEGHAVPAMPDGLKIIVGNANAERRAQAPLLGKHIIFKCGPGSGSDLPRPPRRCGSGVMTVSYRFPNCWDGFRLDSGDHFSHMAYPANGTRCPESHPVVLPRMEAFFRYPVGTRRLRNVRFAGKRYFTAHMDFLNAWDRGGLQHFVDECINAGVDCGKNPAR